MEVLGPGKALRILAADYLAQIAVGIVLFAVLAGVGAATVAPNDPEAAAAFKRITIAVIALTSALAGGLVAWRMTRALFPGSIASDALAAIGVRPAPSKSVLLGALAGGVFALGIIAFDRVLPIPDPGGANSEAVARGGWPLHVFAVVAVLVAPLVEEFLVRGVVFTGLRARYSAWTAGALATLIFVAMHGLVVLRSPAALVMITLVGIAALVARIRSGSLLPGIAMHALYNLLITLAMYGAAAPVYGVNQ